MGSVQGSLDASFASDRISTQMNISKGDALIINKTSRSCHGVSSTSGSRVSIHVGLSVSAIPLHQWDLPMWLVLWLPGSPELTSYQSCHPCRTRTWWEMSWREKSTGPPWVYHESVQQEPGVLTAVPCLPHNIYES